VIEHRKSLLTVSIFLPTTTSSGAGAQVTVCYKKPVPKSDFRRNGSNAIIPPMAEGAFDDATTIMEALFDIRSNTDYIIDLLTEDEEDDGEEEAREP
jgi:hypothetical protein